MRPVSILLLEKGTVDDKPSLCIVGMIPNTTLLPKVYMQISVAMLNDGLKDIGYEIKKLDK